MKLPIIALTAAFAACSMAPVQVPVQPSLAFPAASGKSLLYLSDYGSVDVYDYETTTEVSTLSGFNHAAGSCTDSEGDVFIANTGDADLLKFTHGGMTPSYVYDPYPDPVDCSVDPTTGNLAVVNEYGALDSTPGNIAVYAQAKGKPKIFKSATQLFSAAYDGKGDLFVSGYQANEASFAVLPAGGSKLQSVSLQHSGTTYAPYVRWDGEYFVVEFEGEDFTPIWVMYTLKGTSGIEEGFMAVDTAEGMGPFWLGRIGVPKAQRRANQLVASVQDSGVLYWDYPEGGLYVFRFGYSDEYGGVTVSSQ